MIGTEFLTQEEVETLTGRSHRSAQVDWLVKNSWKFELNAANSPVIGRWYARAKMAGIDMNWMSPGEMPDWSKVA